MLRNPRDVESGGGRRGLARRGLDPGRGGNRGTGKSDEAAGDRTEIEWSAGGGGKRTVDRRPGCDRAATEYPRDGAHRGRLRGRDLGEETVAVCAREIGRVRRLPSPGGVMAWARIAG